MKKRSLLLFSSAILGAFALASCDNEAEDPTSVPVEGENLEPNGGENLNQNEGDNLNSGNGKQLSTHLDSQETVSGSDKLDYIKSKYGIEDHVFDVITIDRLNLLINKNKVDQYGDSVIVFANSNSEVSQEAIKKINDRAIELGVKRIYYFDLLLAGEYGVDIWDNPEETWPNVTDQTGSKVTQAFVKIKNTLLDQTSLGDVDDDFNADNDVFLFVNNHEEGTSEIKKSLLIDEKDNIKNDAIDEVLKTVINDKGEFIGTSYSDYDYFNNSIYRSATTNNYYPTYEEFKDKFYVRSITYYELRLLLETEGEHNILFSGSWCGDSKAAIALVVENAARYSNGEPVYVFDFRLSNGVISGSKGEAPRETSVVDVEGLTGPNAVITGVGYLGEAIISQFGEFAVGKQNTELKYVDGGYESFNVENGKINVEYKDTTGQKKFRSPSLFKYNKDAQKHITDSWVHEVTDWDIVYEKSQGVPAYQTGDLIDYELSSGYLSDQQKAYGRYKLAVFLGAPELTYSAPNINVSEGDSALDSGCGDDNDPIDNLNQETLIPNHGSDTYDVSRYDITIELQEGALPKNAKFIGETKITATANKDINNRLSLDFRRQKITSVYFRNITTGEIYLDNVSGDSLNTYITRVNDDEQDIQKLFINFGNTILKEEEFEIFIEYETTTIDNSATNSQYGQYAEGFNLHVDEKGYTAVGEPFGSTYWFPNNNTPADGAKYTITLKAPIEYTLISNGVRTSNKTDAANGIRTTVWEVSKDTATYQIFATFSKNITAFESTTIQKGLYTTKDGVAIPTYIYVNNDAYKANRYKIDRYIGLLPQYISLLEDKIGSYKGESLGFVFENVGDGHGEPASWGAIETKDRPFFTNKTVVGENTFVHEFVHQWFGDAVRIENWDNLWLNEGFATYGASLYYELTKDNYNAIDTYERLYNSKGETSKLWQIAPANLPNESDLFGGQKSAYNRGALALAVLREGIGDEAFFNVLSSWISNNDGTAKTTEDFINLVKANLPVYVTESEIDTFKNVWLYGTTKPNSFTLTGEPIKIIVK